MRLHKLTLILLAVAAIVALLIVGNKYQGAELGFDPDTSWGELWWPAFVVLGAVLNEFIQRRRGPQPPSALQ